MTYSHFEQMKISDLTVDPVVQRQLDLRRVRQLAEDWDSDMAGVLTVSHRHTPTIGFDGPDYDESYVILDGQTRARALEAVAAESDEDPILTCEVFEGLTTAQEAAMFLKHNNRKAVTPRDLFRLAVTSQQEWALDIRDIAAAYGWYVQGGVQVKGHRAFQAVTAVRKIYDLDDGRALRKTFAVIDKAWGGTSGAVCSETVYGIGLLFAENPTGIDAPGLARKLSKTGLNRFISAVGDRRRTHPGMSIRAAAQQWTVEIYNRGRRTHRV